MADRNSKWSETAPLISLALMHTMVRSRTGDPSHTSVTNLDVHDLARLARTYGLSRLYIVSPVASQQEHVRRILEHWTVGHGAAYNPHRAEALRTVHICSDLDSMVAAESSRHGRMPALIGTAARKISNKIIDYGDVYGRMLSAGSPVVLVFGTGHGLHEEAVRKCNAFLKPIAAGGDYNHLSVRSAATITVDRIFSSM